jgi:hypothetical protein
LPYIAQFQNGLVLTYTCFLLLVDCCLHHYRVVAVVVIVARILYSCAVLGEKRVGFRGRKRLYHIKNQISNFFDQLSILESAMGSGAYAKRKEEVRESLGYTNSKNQIEDHKAAYQSVLSLPHNPTAKELESGVDTSPYIAGKLQFGKLHNKGDNRALLLTECKGRYQDSSGQQDVILDIDAAGIMKLKELIKADEVRRNPEAKNEAGKFFTPLFTVYGDYDFDLIQ